MSNLSKRAVACKGWRWMPGMSVDGMVVVDADESGLEVVRKGTVQDWPLEYAYPDLTDPATLGCLLALVREAYGDRFAKVQGSERIGRHVWRCLARSRADKRTYMLNGDTEAEALVAALEAAEGREVSDE
jgi:hypothetical protein